MNQEEYERTMQSQAIQSQASDTAVKEGQRQQQQYVMEQAEKGLAEAQLDVDEMINEIHNLLQGKQYVETSPGIREWKEPKDNRRTLTDWGVQRIIQSIRFHINKNNLLSNYNEQQINRLMYRFMTEMNNMILLKYERLFVEPSFEECKTILKAKMKERENLKKFTLELLGQQPKDAEISKEIKEEMEGRIEEEMRSIKQTQRKERLKEYGLIMEELEAAVYATYNRAYRGEERGSLRRHSHFSEIISPTPISPEKSAGIFRRRGR